MNTLQAIYTAFNQTEKKYEDLPKNYFNDLEYLRNHPIIPDWEEWSEIVQKYYSSYSRDILQLVEEISCRRSRLSFEVGDTDYQLASNIVYATEYNKSPISGWHEWTFARNKAKLIKIVNGDYFGYVGRFRFDDSFRFPTMTCVCFDVYKDQVEAADRGRPFTRHEEDIYAAWREIEPDHIPFTGYYPFNVCPHQQNHLRTIFCSFLYRAIHSSYRASTVAYYKRVLRLILALPVKYLKKIDQRFIEDVMCPQDPSKGPKNLLRFVYDRIFLDDGVTVDEVLKIVLNKNFQDIKDRLSLPTQQSASGSLELLLTQFCHGIKQQSWFTVDHNVTIDETFYAKFASTMETAKTDFVAGLHNSILTSAREVSMIMAMTGAAFLLSHALVKHGVNIISIMLQMLYRFCTGSTDNVQGIVQQDAGVSVPVLPWLVINKILKPPVHIIQKLWENPQTDKIMRRIGYLGDPKMARGIDKIAEWIQKLINDVINWYKSSVLGLHVMEDIDSVCSPVENWYAECDVFVTKYYSGNMQWNDINWSVLMNLYSRGTALARQPRFSDARQDIWRVVNKLGNILEKYNQHGRGGASVRSPPVTLYLFGDTGVGKSSVTYPFAAEILKGINDRENLAIDLVKYWKSLVYMRSAEQEFWDGYENQLVTVFDDFNQQVDSAANPSTELFEVIRASNSFPYPLHMASIDQKASTAFTSKIIMVSSNMAKPKTQSLNFEKALLRRFDLSVRVTRKCGVKPKEGEFDPDIYIFERYDMVTGQEYGEMTYDEVVAWSVDRYFERKGFVDSMDKYITRKLSEETPVQQGVGTAAGNTVCAVRSILRGTVDFAYTNYVDFVSVIKGEVMLPLMNQLRILLQTVRQKCEYLTTTWRKFVEEHPYFVKALKMIGVACLVLAGVAMVGKMFKPEKSTKVMSAAQFVKSTPLSSEAYTPAQIKMMKAEGYAPQQVKPIKTESYTPAQIKQIKAESADPKKMEPIYIESHDSIGVCACGFDDEIEKNHGMPINLLPCDHGVMQQAILDRNSSEMLLKVIRSNLYKMYEGNSGDPIGHCMFLRGRVSLMPHHYVSKFKSMDADDFICFKNVLVNRAFKMKISDVLLNYKPYLSPSEEDGPVVSRDVLTLVVPSAIIHGDISSYFATKPSLSYVNTTRIVMPFLCNNNVRNSDRAVVSFKYGYGRSVLTVKDESGILGEDGRTIARYMRELWQYSMDTEKGDCGCPVFVRNRDISPGKIIGMHVAGWDEYGLGYATPMYKEEIDEILALYDRKDVLEQIQPQVFEAPRQQFYLPDGEFLPVGKVKLSVAQPNVTKECKSLVFGKIQEPTTKPCALVPWKIDGEVFDPRKYRLERLGKESAVVDAKVVNIAADALRDEISQQVGNVDMEGSPKSVYTFEEACLGIDGEEFVNSVKRTTSPGYPFIHMQGFKSRKEIFGNEDKIDFSSNQAYVLRQRVENIIEKAKKGVVLPHIFMDTLKDERKPLHKAHKTRLFSAGPLDYLIACKMYFNGVVDVLQRHRNLSHISVGSNPESFDWNEIAVNLLRKSPHMVAGDFEGFDASQNSTMLQAAGRVLIELSKRHCGTTDEEAEVMNVLLVSLLHSYHINRNEVYQWTHSLPSGHYLTAIINSIFVCLSFTTIWLYHKDEVSYVGARRFYQKCGIVAYGDDHILSIPWDELDGFNQLTIPNLFKRIGLSYTMEDKDAQAVVPSRPLTDVSYLKRKFIFDEDRKRWTGPLAIETILESPMWMKKNPDPRGQTIEQLEWAIRELSVHPLSTWERWHPLFVQLLQELRVYTDKMIYTEVRASVLD